MRVLARIMTIWLAICWQYAAPLPFTGYGGSIRFHGAESVPPAVQPGSGP